MYAAAVCFLPSWPGYVLSNGHVSPVSVSVTVPRLSPAIPLCTCFSENPSSLAMVAAGMHATLPLNRRSFTNPGGLILAQASKSM